MMLTILFLSTIGYLSLICTRFRLRFTTAQFLYVALLVSCLYIFGVFGFLREGYIAITAVGIAAFVFALVKYVQNISRFAKYKNSSQSLVLTESGPRKKYSHLCTSTAIINLLLIHEFKKAGWNIFYVIPFIVLYRLISENFIFTGWDEFSHWALSIKIVYESDLLYLERTPMMYKHYPPIQQLLQYYYLQFGGWSEKNVLFAQGAFVLSALISATGGLYKKTSLLTIATLTASCAIFYYFGYDFSHIYVDPLLATVFASCLILAISEEGNKGAILLILTLPVLVLIKQTGLILALVVLAVYSVNSYLQLRRQMTINNEPISTVSSTCLCIGLVFLSVVVSFKSWQWYLSSINSTQILDYPSFSKLFEPPMLERFELTVVEFMRRLNTGEFFFTGYPLHRFSSEEIRQIFISNGLVKFIWIFFNEIEYSSRPVGFSIISISFALIFLSGLSVFFYQKDKRINLCFFFASVSIGCFGYLLFLLLTYLFFFKEVESIGLVSFERYAATFYLAWTIVILSVITSSAERMKSRVVNASLIGLLSLTYVYAPPQFFRDMRGISPPPTLREAREKVEKLAYIAKRHMKEDERAYFVIQNSSGLEKYIFNYSILPFGSSWWCWSLGEKYSENDSWTCDSKLIDLLNGYNYLVIFRADERFWKDNMNLHDSLHPLKASGVYKIVYEKNVPTKLIEVNN